MSKKLIKTAKQQFEERLKVLGNHVALEINGETFHSGIDKKGHFHILRIGDADIEYSEFYYGCTLLELYNNEEFLDKLATEFAIGRGGIKPILEWWLDADKNHEPFDLSDIVKFAPTKAFVEFKDLYEDVPDEETFANTRAQARKEIEDNGMVLEYESDNGIYYAADVDGKFQVICIWNESVPTKYIFGESRKKVCDSSVFRSAMLMNLALHRGQEEVDKFAAWIKDSTKPEPFDVYDIIEALNFAEGMAIVQEYEEKPDNRIVMNMYDPFYWLRIERSGTWDWISEFCNDVNEYGRLDVLYDIIDGELDVKDKFENPPTMEEIKADYEKSFPLLMAGVFENLAEAIKSGELKFRMDYTKES